MGINWLTVIVSVLASTITVIIILLNWFRYISKKIIELVEKNNIRIAEIIKRKD